MRADLEQEFISGAQPELLLEFLKELCEGAPSQTGPKTLDASPLLRVSGLLSVVDRPLCYKLEDK